MKSILSVCLNLATWHTHGSTYAEAIQHGEEVLELLIEEYQSKGRMLPTPIDAKMPIAILQRRGSANGIAT
jgi:predicted RNase H-like HicB family nuclease